MQIAEHHREQFELAYATAWAKDRDGGETPEQLAAEIKAWRVGDTYEAEFIRLRFGWEGYQWARAGQCLAQIEEPAQPVAEICSASHDDAQFGERPQLPEGVMCIEQVGGDVIGRPTDYGFKHGRGIVHGAQLFTSEQLRAYFDLGRQQEAGAPGLTDGQLEDESYRVNDEPGFSDAFRAGARFAERVHGVTAAAARALTGEADWWRGRADEIEAQVARSGSKEAMRCYTDMRTLLQAAAPALEAPAAPVTLMTEDQASKWAWDQIREEVGTKGWTAGDSCNFFGFFLHGWNYRGQYELQRPAALLARAALAAAPQAPAAPAEPVYQISQPYHTDPKNTWRDASEAAYDVSVPARRRVLFTGPAAPAAPAVDALDSDRWRALEGQMDAGRVSLTVHHTEAEQWDGRTISDAGELQDYADSLAAQAAAKGEHDE